MAKPTKKEIRNSIENLILQGLTIYALPKLPKKSERLITRFSEKLGEQIKDAIVKQKHIEKKAIKKVKKVAIA